MAEISANTVKQLREMTGLGMMECKKALVETHGDINAAVDLLRVKSGAKASKIAGRIAAEGVISIYANQEATLGALVEVNCETDFVAKDASFLAFAQRAAEIIAKTNPTDVEDLAQQSFDAAQTLEEARKALVMKIGENISIRRFVRYQAQGHLAHYLHGSKIGVLVDLTGGEASLGEDIAMHIAASKPVCISADQVPAELIAKEREIYAAKAEQSGKPANIVEKMIEGSIAKYLAEVTLLGQPFVRDDKQTVDQLLTTQKAKVNAFSLYIVGEGIEKKVTDFAAEVAAAAQVG